MARAPVRDAALPVLPTQVFAEVTFTPVPSLPLADALLFADTMPQVLQLLALGVDRWMEAIVLATPFWAPGTGRLNVPINLGAGIPPLAEASLRFDPDRELRIASFAPHSVGRYTKRLLATARRIRLHESFLPSAIPALVELLPSLNAVYLGNADQLAALVQKTSVRESLLELGVAKCGDLEDLGIIGKCTSLRSLTLDEFELLLFCADELYPLTELEHLRLGGCMFANSDAVLKLRVLNSLCRGDASASSAGFDMDADPGAVPLELLDTFFAFLGSGDAQKVRVGATMLSKIFAVDRNPWDNRPHDELAYSRVPQDMFSCSVALLHSADTNDVLQGIKIFSRAFKTLDPPVDQAIEEGCLAAFAVHLLRDDLPKLQSDVLALLSRIAMHLDPKSTAFSSDLVRSVLRLAGSPNETGSSALTVIRETCLKCKAARELFLQHSTLRVLQDALDQEELKGNAGDALASLCVGDVGEEHREEILRMAVQLLGDPSRSQQCSGLSVVAGLAIRGAACIEQILKVGCLDRIIELANSSSSLLWDDAARAISSLTCGTAHQRQRVLDVGALRIFSALLSKPLGGGRFTIYRAIANIVSLGEEKVQAVIDAGLFQAMMKNDGGFAADTVSAIFATTKHGTRAQLEKLTQIGVLTYLGGVVERSESPRQLALMAIGKFTIALKD